jgi:hypothetical protein
MIQLKTTSSAPLGANPQRTLAAARDRATRAVSAQAATILRALILALVVLQFVLVALTLLTGRVEIGGPIAGGVLLIGLGAAQFGR